MNDAALLQEFIARKEQVLNLETRLFILLFVFEAVFVIFYVRRQKDAESAKTSSILILSVITLFFMEMLAINGKMGLISIYLRQMETYMASKGMIGAVWESKALDAIIFRPGNAFTLPAGIVILILTLQYLYSIYRTVCSFICSRMLIASMTVAIALLVAFIIVKTVTVDFGHDLPTVFPENGERTMGSDDLQAKQK